MVTDRCLALAIFGAALIPAAAQAACEGANAKALSIGTAEAVAPGAARAYTVDLSAGQGIYVDLSTLAPAAAHDEDDDEHSEAAPTRDLALCDARGSPLVPLAGEVFEKGGSVSDIPDGRRLRFVAPAAGRYRIAVAAAGTPREILVRTRELGAPGSSGITATALGRVETADVSSKMQRVFSFPGTAGQWVELKSTSDNDTVLRLAGPNRQGNYSQIAENDDSDGLNPVIRRKLPVTGTYYLQVDALGDETKEFTLTLKAVAAPPPPAPPAALRVGSTISGRLSGEDDSKLYLLPVVAGHNYRIDLTAPYDGVVAIGLPNPIEPDDGDDASAGFASVKQQDTGTTGTEHLNFTARSSGQLLVQVKSFGIGETDGSYRLVAADLGG
jgi:hypothetical protein